MRSCVRMHCVPGRSFAMRVYKVSTEVACIMMALTHPPARFFNSYKASHQNAYKAADCTRPDANFVAKLTETITDTQIAGRVATPRNGATFRVLQSRMTLLHGLAAMEHQYKDLHASKTGKTCHLASISIALSSHCPGS